MKEIPAYEVIREILKTQETCSIPDLNGYKSKFEKQHKNEYIYVAICRDDIWYAQEYFADEFYWDEKREAFIKQESIICPVCGDKYYKYPNNKKYNDVLNFINNENNKSELQSNSR